MKDSAPRAKDAAHLRQRDRAARPPQGWPLLIVAIAVVIFTGLTLWYVNYPRQPELKRPSDHELIHQLAAGWRARYPQIPGPPQSYLQAARVEELAGRPGAAAEQLGMALSLDPDAPDVLLALVGLSVRSPAVVSLPPLDAASLVDVVARFFPEDPGLNGARAWLALSRPDPAAALALTEQGPATLEGAWARLRATELLSQDQRPAARALLSLAPAHSEAAEALVRAELAAGDLAEAARDGQAALDAGAQGPALARLMGDVADLRARFADAVRWYRRAGVDVHAAAVVVQEGLPDEDGAAARALDSPDPAATLHRLWAALIRGDATAAGDAAAALEQMGLEGPEFDLARAAAALAEGDVQATQALMQGRRSPEAHVLQARAAERAGDPAAARDAFAAALRAQPWNLAIHRARIAWLARADPAAALAAVRALGDLDPVAVSLGRLVRRRDAPWGALAPDPWPLALFGPSERALVQVLEGGAVPSDAEAVARDLPRFSVHALLAQLQGGQDGAALAALAISLLPGDPAALALRAEQQRRQGQPEAKASLEAAVAASAPPAGAEAQGPPGLTLIWARAASLAAAGEVEAARALVAEAAQAWPDLTGLWALRADLLDEAAATARGP